MSGVGLALANVLHILTNIGGSIVGACIWIKHRALSLVDVDHLTVAWSRRGNDNGDEND